MSQQIELKIPDIGGHAGVDVIEVSVKVGDRVEKDDTLVTLETDKATMDVPAEAAGVVKEVRVKVGDKVGEGDVIVLLEAESAAAAPVAAPAAATPVAATPAAAPVAVAPAPVAAAPAAPAAAGGRQTLTVPDIGGHDGVDVIDVAVKAGDRIAVDDTLITLETDKATMDVPATAAGLVVEVKVRVGDKVGEGAAIVVIEAEGQAAASPAAAPAPVAAPAAVVTAPAASPVVAAAPRAVAPVDQVAFVSAHAGPSVRRLARELGVDLSKVSGTGRKNRITESDVKTFVKGVLQNPAAAVAAAPVNGSGLDLLPWPKVDFARFGPVTSEPLSRIKKISGANLSRNWVMIPHVTQFDEADITDMEAFRKQMGEELKADGVKLTPLAFLIKAAVKALQKFPAFNASLDGDNLVLKQYVNIGFAADTPNGLVVPVVKDADRKSLIEIAQETGVLAKKARDGKLLPGDMQGGCFSISSLGGIGGTAFTPIINAPEVAILGVSKSAIKPVWNGKEFAPRLMLPLSLSYDHRVIDGAAAARFTSYLSQVLGDIRRLML
ncbi:dihydrolipoyllysine-residue acetyltransferase [Microvirgula aerodenitrificans]|uniref:Acetyltransferase component of pyruvate dehydrogenase complex n=1 Tax=Microvirgula aerodenitrificans TaxID=57480 RepID=A0A2S0P996_9NEIS|nr:dihydrolipoyllysine-residue acetyltransferase [Microvirgula aerodenitrificans]AVY93938.1 dihydrolipoyllysine-residue acetyltransferase [Microvirgula aerodenitrificans]